MKTIVEVEWGDTGGVLHTAVVAELRNGQPIHPVILSMIDKKTKVLLHFLIEALCLPISLRMKRRRRKSLDAERVVQRLGELGDELGAAVADDAVLKAVMHPDPVAPDGSNAFRVDLRRRWRYVHLLAESVHGDHDRVVAARLGERSDDVY